MRPLHNTPMNDTLQIERETKWEKSGKWQQWLACVVCVCDLHSPEVPSMSGWIWCACVDSAWLCVCASGSESGWLESKSVAEQHVFFATGDVIRIAHKYIQICTYATTTVSALARLLVARISGKISPHFLRITTAFFLRSFELLLKALTVNSALLTKKKTFHLSISISRLTLYQFECN